MSTLRITRTATPSKGRKERARISLSLSLPPFLEEQCDVAPHSSRSNVLVSPPVARIVCTRFLLCETGMVAMRCDAVRFGYGVVSTAPVCRQFSGGRPASPVVRVSFILSIPVFSVDRGKFFLSSLLLEVFHGGCGTVRHALVSAPVMR